MSAGRLLVKILLLVAVIVLFFIFLLGYMQA